MSGSESNQSVVVKPVPSFVAKTKSGEYIYIFKNSEGTCWYDTASNFDWGTDKEQLLQR